MEARTSTSPGYQTPQPVFDKDWTLYPEEHGSNFAPRCSNGRVESPWNPSKSKSGPLIWQRRKCLNRTECKLEAPCITTWRQDPLGKVEVHPSFRLEYESSTPNFTPPTPRPAPLPSPDFADSEELGFWGTSAELQDNKINVTQNATRSR